MRGEIEGAGRFNGVCLITDSGSCGLSHVEMVGVALEAGIKWVQYRDKSVSRRNTYLTALQVRQITRQFGAFFIVNDYADIAAAVDADGVHLGQDDLPVSEARKVLGPDRVIGISTHCLDEALKAQEAGADYIGFGPVYETATKDAGPPVGTDVLGNIREKLSIPVVAIGGVTFEVLPEVLSCGVRAVAVASALLRGRIRDNVRDFLQLMGSA